MARETAWYCWEDWNNVRSLLYNFEDFDSQLEGIQMIEMWKCRVRSGSLPISVELTATLIAAHLFNAQSMESNRHQAQLSSAMALVRFVNGITDQLQTGLYAQSVQLIADKINIPDWMVDLRHEATHAQLPGIETLRSGIMIALNWLNVNYWEETSLKISDMEQSLYANITSYVFDYVDIIFDVLGEKLVSEDEDGKTSKESKKAQNKKLSRCFEISQVVLKAVNPGNLRNVVSAFVQTGCLIPNENQLQKIGMCEKIESLQETEVHIVYKLVELWKPLLDVIQIKYSVFIELVVKEVLKDTQRNKNSSHCLLSLYLLSLMYPNCHQIISSFLIRNPCPFGFQILEYIVSQDSFEIDIKQKLQSILATFKSCVDVLMKPINVDIDLRSELESDATNHKFLDIIDSIKVSQTAESEDVKPSKFKWNLVSSDHLSSLPPMGEFVYPKHFQYLNLQRDTNDLFLHKLVEQPHQQSPIDSTGSKQTTYTTNQLTSIIENLFLDTSILICDDDSDNESSATEEYCIDTDMPWDESSIDFEIKFEDKPKIIVDVVNIDVSKIMFM